MKFKFRPITLAIAAAFAIAGCSPSGEQSTADSSGAAALPVDLSAIQTPISQFSAADLEPTIDACTDLNGFVNSRWLATNPVPSDRTSWGSFELLAERSLEIQKAIAESAMQASPDANPIAGLVGDFYAAGLDVEAANAAGLAPIQAQLDAIAALDGSEAIANYLRQSYADGQGFLFGFFANADFMDSNKVIAYGSQGGLGLPEKAYYLEDREDYTRIRSAYLEHIARTLELAGADPEAAAASAQQVMDFETRLARASLSRVELRDPAKRYNPVTLEQADALTPNFSWSQFFEALGVDRPETFSLAMTDFFGAFDAMLADTPPEAWQSYLRFHTIDNMAPFLTEALEQQNFAFYGKTLRGQQEQQERWKRVLNTLNGSIGEALGQLYVEVAFPPESKAKMQTLVANLSDALKVRLEGLEWMGEDTKAKALEKWASFTPKIGYPDKWRDWDGLILSRDSYAANVLATQGFNYRFMLSKIGKPVDRSEWFMTPQTVNAYYSPQRNEIVFPAAILQPPFFDPEADDALNYGGIVAVIGHEMIHGYDDQGSKFAADGTFSNWWSEADRANFEARTDLLVEQFNGYEALPGLHVNGKLTLGENIADLGGLTVAYDALKRAQGESFSDPMIDGYSQSQRFFMNWATIWRRNFTEEELKVRLNTDSHAPANFRAVGAPSNMDSFSAAFECSAPAPMVRSGDAQVVIW
ncbi:MAG: M13-type metalloendopeptidase [Xanthomonadaceae bacterium]|nr:M13-type metalloendopeptidase [Xanthomonadaceae bacterium]